MNRGQLKTRVARTLGIRLGTGDEAADTALLEELANEAVINILSRTRVHVRDLIVTPDTGVGEFEVDGAVIMRVHGVSRLGADDGSTALLFKQGRESLLSNEYTFAGYNRILLGQQTSGESFHLWYTPTPTPMTDDTHDPATEAYGLIPIEFHPAILNYMLWWTADKAGDQGKGRGEAYRQIYEGRDGMGGPGSNLGQIKTATNTRGAATIIRRAHPTLASDYETRYWQG